MIFKKFRLKILRYVLLAISTMLMNYNIVLRKVFTVKQYISNEKTYLCR